ncbi:MAG: hypothetical protein JXR03_15605 [Cyclobacteriaceae bacterium]
MKKEVLCILIMFLVGAALPAQDFSRAVQDKIKNFDFMIGTWTGEGAVISPDGNSDISQVTEVIGYEVGNTVIQMRGLGTKTLESGEKITVHDALGVLSYDYFQQKYKLYSFISKGMQTIADIDLKEEGHVVWWIKAGSNMTIRYTINVKDDKWNEVGERSSDGETWNKFFEMNLTKQ